MTTETSAAASNADATTSAAATTTAPAADATATTQPATGATAPIADAASATAATTLPADAAATTSPAADAAPVVLAEPTLPQGVTLAPETKADLLATATELKLPQEGYQKLVDKAVAYKQGLDQSLNESIANVQAEWLTQSKADKEIGGDNFEVNIAEGNKALNAFGTPALQAMLKETGLINHPEVIRYNLTISKSISQDTFVGTTSANDATAPGVSSLAAAGKKLYGPKT